MKRFVVVTLFVILCSATFALGQTPPDYVFQTQVIRDSSTGLGTFLNQGWSIPLNESTGAGEVFAGTSNGSASSNSLTAINTMDEDKSSGPCLGGSGRILWSRTYLYAKNRGTHMVTKTGNAYRELTSSGPYITSDKAIGRISPDATQYTGQGVDSISVSQTMSLGWDSDGCGSGTTTFAAYPGATYGLLGTFVSSVEVGIQSCDSGHGEASSEMSLSVVAPTYTDPLGIIYGPTVGGSPSDGIAVGQTGYFDADWYDPDDGSTADGKGICSKSWTIKRNGSVISGLLSNQPGGGVAVTPSTPGNYTLELTIRDNENVTKTFTKPFPVYPPRDDRSQRGDALSSDCAGGSGGFGNDPLGTPSGDQLGGFSDPFVSSAVNPNNGGISIDFYDPITTRGYPLKNDIRIHSQRRFPGLSSAMGNAEFSYAMRLTQSSVAGVPHMFLVDALGEESDFGPAAGPFAPETGVYSVLTATGGGGFILSGAGSPGRASSAGNFQYEFDATGKLLRITDPSANIQEIVYSGGNLVRVDDLSTSRAIEFFYDSPGFITRVVEGPITTYLSYTSGNLSGVEVKESTVTARSATITYNPGGTPAEITRDGDSATTITFSYVPAGNGRTLGNVTWPTGASNIDYFEIPNTGAHARSSRLSTQGEKTVYDYDSLGNIIRIQYPDFVGQIAAKVVTMGYAGRNMTSWSDGTYTITRSYNSLGLLSTMSDNIGRSWTYTYSGVDLTSVSDAIGSLYTLTYGDATNPHSPTKLEDASGNVWTYAYNAYGQLTSLAPPSGSPTGAIAYTYEENPSSPAFGWLKGVTDGDGDITTYDSYSPLGDLLSITSSPSSGVQNTTEYLYDAVRRLVRTTHPDGKTIERGFTGRNLTSHVDESGTLSEFDYCPTCGKPTSALYPLSKLLVWNLDGDFQESSFIDGRSKQTTYTRGDVGELKSYVYPDGFTYEQTYWKTGALKLDGPSSFQVQYGYDAASRLTGVSLSGNTTYQIAYTLRADDLPSQIVDEVGTRTLTYLPNRWLEKVSHNYSAKGLSADQEVAYAYNPDGSIDTMTWSSGGILVASWEYSYDGAGRVTGIQNSFGETTSYVYDDEGKIVSQTNANGTSEATTYNEARNWPTFVEQKSAGTTFESFALEYDNGLNTVGNLTAVMEFDSSVAAYGYDALYRLTSETRTGTNPYSRTYGYDLSNNVTTVNGSTFGTYDSGNKLTAITGGSVSNHTRGYLSSASYSGYSFSGATMDRRFKLTDTTSRKHVYNAEGRRAATKASSPSTAPHTFFIFDGDRIIGEITPSGATVAYTWGPNGIVSERLLSGTPKSLWYHFGPQGETRRLTDATGAVVDTYRYTAYGVSLGTTGSDANPFRYGGRVGYYTDSNVSGAVLAGQRWYLPGLYRWQSRDPIRYVGGDNVFGYVSANPVRWKDPKGLFREAATDRQQTQKLQQPEGATPFFPSVRAPDTKPGGDVQMCGGSNAPDLLGCLAACDGGAEAMALWCARYVREPRLMVLCGSASLIGGTFCKGFCYARFVD